MRGPQFQELSERIGFQLNTIKNVDVEDGKSGITEHPILSIINLARLKKDRPSNRVQRKQHT